MSVETARPWKAGGFFGSDLWPFVVLVDGRDLVVPNVLATCFGGAFDPQDNGETASGISTKDPTVDGVSLPMRVDSLGVLACSPLPKMPWGTVVEVTIDGVTYTPKRGVIDLGPGRLATTNSIMAAHALDLTVAAALHFSPPGADPKSLARTFERRASYRVKDGAKFLT